MTELGRILAHNHTNDVRYLVGLIDDLAQALLKYGRHKTECQMYGLHACTCGWYGEYLERDEIIRTLARFQSDTEVKQ